MTDRFAHLHDPWQAGHTPAVASSPRARVPFAGLSLLLIVALTFSAATAPREAVSADWSHHSAPDRSALLSHTAVRSAQRIVKRDRVVPAIVLTLARSQRADSARAAHPARGICQVAPLSAHLLDLPPPALA
ncbi:MAG: hypothetical protein IT432_04725 [Phycisphaerales bacterium]|nr:hypothetical protein [Phycisphaerales bacterium]